jgi:hypothetical protein
MPIMSPNASPSTELPTVAEISPPEETSALDTLKKEILLQKEAHRAAVVEQYRKENPLPDLTDDQISAGDRGGREFRDLQDGGIRE